MFINNEGRATIVASPLLQTLGFYMQGPNNIQSERIINSAITNFKQRMKWLFFLVLAITPILTISSYLSGNVDLKVLLFVMLLWAVVFYKASKSHHERKIIGYWVSLPCAALILIASFFY
jgi:hypothetical protein